LIEFHLASFRKKVGNGSPPVVPWRDITIAVQACQKSFEGCRGYTLLASATPSLTASKYMLFMAPELAHFQSLGKVLTVRMLYVPKIRGQDIQIRNAY